MSDATAPRFHTRLRLIASGNTSHGTSMIVAQNQSLALNVILRGYWDPTTSAPGFIIPLGSSVALGWVFYENVASLHPFSPDTYFDYSPLMVIIWTAVGIGILVVMKLRGREEWLFKAGEAAHERPETAAEAAHRPAL